jgi:hypothetical protein
VDERTCWGWRIVLFLDAFDLDDIEDVGSEPIDWIAWRTRHGIGG